MNIRASDIFAVALATALAAAGAATLESPVLRTIVGLPLVFYLPGRALLRAALGEPRNDLTAIVLAGGLSLAATIFCGLALNLAGSLTPARWAIALGAVTLAACGVAYARDRRVPTALRAPTKLPPLRANQAVMLACSGAIVIAAAIGARHEVLAHPEFAFTELWMTPSAGGGALTVGIRNVERTPSSYDLEVVLDGRVVTIRRSIDLRVRESWVADFALPIWDGEARIAEARLFKNGNDRLVYRRVWLKTEPRGLRP
jgi:uncharacterized membrane protein